MKIIMIDLTISILNFNNEKLLEECLRSIYETTKKISFEIWVIDNYSRDKSVEMVRSKFPQVNLIVNTEHKGFSTNHNQILSQCKSKYALVLSEDVIIKPNALDCMVEFMDNHSDVGILGPKEFFPDGRLQKFHYVEIRSPWTDLLEDFMISPFLRRFFPDLRFPGQLYMSSTKDYEYAHEVATLHGSCMMFRKKMLDQIGLLEEKFYFYCEEPDICIRAKRGGWKVYYTPDAQIIHYFAATTRKTNPYFMIEKGLNTMHSFYKKFYGVHGTILIGCITIAAAIFLLCILPVVYVFDVKKRDVIKRNIITHLRILHWYFTLGGRLSSKGQNVYPD
ncbi:MAG: glycosyltransferase family 2 protein [bacterium]